MIDIPRDVIRLSGWFDGSRWLAARSVGICQAGAGLHHVQAVFHLTMTLLPAHSVFLHSDGLRAML